MFERALGLAIAALLLWAGAAQAAPARIVSLVPSLTEAVCELGACDRLVGVDRYSNWPAQVSRLPRLGGLEDAQLERIVALKPDLVLISPASRVLARLQGLGLKVLVLEARTQAETQVVLERLAVALGQAGAGEALWARMQARIALAAARVPPAWRGASTYFEVASAPYAAGASSFIGETLASLGLANVVGAELGPFPRLNPEFVVRARPQLVIAAQQATQEMARRPGWTSIPALAQGRACGFAPLEFEVLIRPGPRLPEAAEALVDCLERLPPPGAAVAAKGQP